MAILLDFFYHCFFKNHTFYSKKTFNRKRI